MRSLLLRGTAGSLLILVGALAYMPVPRPSRLAGAGITGLVRHASWGRPLGLVLSVAGLVLLTWAWWSLRRHAFGRPDGLVRVRLAAVAWSLPLIVAPPVFSGDGWSYVATGYLAGHGFSPYLWTPSILSHPLRSAVNGRWLFTTTPYGPTPLAWGGLASQVTSNPWLLLIAYRLLAVLALILIAWAVPRVARRAGQDPVRATWLAVASPFVVAQGVGGMHHDLLTGALMLAAVAVTSRNRWFWGAVLTGLAASVKIPGAIVGVAVVLLAAPYASAMLTRLWLTVRVMAVAVTVLVVTGVVSGVGTGWVRSLAVPAQQHTVLAVPYLAGSFVQAFVTVAAGRTAIPWVLVAQFIAVLAVVALALRLLLRRTDRRSHRELLLASAGLLLAVTVLSPVSHYWYYLWCLPLLASVRLPREASAALVGTVAVLGLVGFADPGLHLALLVHLATAAVFVTPIVLWSFVAGGRNVMPSAREAPDYPEATHLPSRWGRSHGQN